MVGMDRILLITKKVEICFYTFSFPIFKEIMVMIKLIKPTTKHTNRIRPVSLLARQLLPHAYLIAG